VLSTFFWMLTIIAYIRYVKLNSIKYYCLTVLCYILGLISKPMLVTLPFTLLLLDFWPLNRCAILPKNNAYNKVSGKIFLSNRYWFKFAGPFIEKVPLFLLSAVSCGMTLYAQKEAMKSFELFPLMTRISNAVVSYITYLEKTVWPFNLSIFYPFQPVNPFRVILCATALGLISLLVFAVKKNIPYLAMGWLWYLGTLIPVIGIVQVGSQALADRYTYIPLIGIFIMMVWGLSDMVIRWKYGKTTLWITSVVVFTLLFLLTYHQIGLWKNSEILFKHSLEVTQNNYMALYDLGITLEKKGDIEGAIAHYEEALRINPQHYGAHNNLGALLASSGKTDEGIQHLLAALKINPRLADAYYNLGIIYYLKGDTEQAIEYFQKASNEKNNYKKAQDNLNEAMKNINKINN
jgi:protein O-mannosyl-transferase